MQLAHTVHPGPSGAEPVVLLGSLGSDRRMWDPQVPALARMASVLTVDVRGHGGSPAPAGPYRVAELANDVLVLLNSRGIDRVHLVGLSLGGAIAQRIAIEHPGRVRTLSLLCTAARFGQPAAWTARAEAVRRDGVAAIAGAIAGRWFTPEYAAANPRVVADCLRMIANTDDEGYAACCEALAQWDSRAALSRITAPTLVIAGAQDPATTPDDLRVIADGVARARLHVVTPAAHVASLEQAGQVTALIRDHLTAPIDGTPS
ncbi:3-oxoadipate enol-lactonase [Nocardia jiangsuensis]|uniref:3-oxoadipate enol-lactonase n=1 Tax=Nocardia jiangsuensis TaxID=1691563 RepID=A0ABV8DPD6_9NOCA